MRVRRVAACVVAMAGLACRERSATVKRDDPTSTKSATKPAPKNGRIVGKVRWDGVRPFALPPPPGPCGSAHVAELIIGPEDGLADTLVRVMPGSLPPSPSVATSAKIVSMKTCAFDPRAAIVEEGQDVTFSNDDPFDHSAHGFDFDDAESIFEVRLAPHASTTVHLATIAPIVDIVLVKSDDFSWMRSMLYVADPRWSRITGKTGEFVIDDVPPGEHDVQAYHDGGDEMRGQIRHVVVPGDGSPLRVDFTYPRK